MIRAVVPLALTLALMSKRPAHFPTPFSHPLPIFSPPRPQLIVLRGDPISELRKVFKAWDVERVAYEVRLKKNSILGYGGKGVCDIWELTR